MVYLALEKPMKWILILVVFGIIVFLLYFHFYPEVIRDFFNKTNINFLDIKTGKPKFKAEFEMPENMRANVEMIYEGIISPDLITTLELNDFDRCQLTIKNKDGNLRMIVEFGGKTEFYDRDVEYNPCIIKINEDELEKKILEASAGGKVDSEGMFVDNENQPPIDDNALLIASSNIDKVDTIVFINENTFKVEDKKYKFGKGLIKTENNNVCFIYE